MPPKKTRSSSSGKAGRARVGTASRRGVPVVVKRGVAAPVPQDEPDRRSEGLPPFPIVGIGASAGGLETLSQLLKHLPEDTGMGFVYVQHLDPRHESMLTQLLAKVTSMPVLEARDGMTVTPNHVYVIPPATNLGLVGGRLTLMPREQRSEPNLAIDYFLRSLADDRRNRAIGVILSGTASDGTLGLQAIKAEGGLTFVQDPQTAKYDGMPRSAIGAGAADFVLPPEEIARELATIGKHPYLAFARVRDDDLPVADNDGNLRKIFLMLRMAAGVDFTHYKLSTVKRRIKRRMVLNKIDQIVGYTHYLKNNPVEVDALYRDLLINVTSFFRDPETLEALKTLVFPRLLKENAGNESVRLWVPGCATGEEAYSLAIMLLESKGDVASNVSVQIFATDISDVALEKARAGFYSENAVAGVSRERRRRFFVKVEDGYQVKKTVRDMCLFARQDLSKDPPFSRLDLISCRNVLIYLNATLQKKIIPIFHYALKPSGVLMLGNSETIGSFAGLFRLLDKRNKIYLKKPAAHRPVPGFGGLQLLTASAGAPLRAVLPEPREPDAKKEADRIVLKKYAPASVLVNDNLDILQFRGRTGDFLEPAAGAASLNLLKMTREGLLFELRNLIQRARKQNAVVHSRAHFRANERERDALVEVTPFKPPGAKERYFLVTFDSGTPPHKGATVRAKSARGAETRRIAQLQQELAATNEYLQSTIAAQEATNEELRSALEEIQSSNEELQSVNEELETAKEELQSTNEELTTVNEELQNRNAELYQANNDLLNLLSSVNIPVIMLGEDLRIRRFTPMAEKALNIIPSDIGRPLADLRANFIFPNLETLIHEVMDTFSPRELDIQDRDGRWYSARVRPYKTMDNKIDGAVIALVDIDTIRHSLLTARAERDFARSIVEAIRGPLLVLDDALRVLGANRAFYETFQMQPAQAKNRSLFDVLAGASEDVGLRARLQRTLTGDVVFDDIELECNVPAAGRRRLILNATRIEREAEKSPHVLLAIQDVTRPQTTSS